MRRRSAPSSQTPLPSHKPILRWEVLHTARMTVVRGTGEPGMVAGSAPEPCITDYLSDTGTG